MSKNQVKLISEFVKSDENILFINKINENISIFYQNLLKTFALENKIVLKFDENNTSNFTSTDLFGSKEIKIFNHTSEKKIQDCLKIKIKKIIFCEYKIYKKFSNSYLSVNAYNYENDICNFLIGYCKINNANVIDYCKKHPEFIYSETSKFLINKNVSSFDQDAKNLINPFMEIRKSLNILKKNNDIKGIYKKIKEEAKYKKLSFLTY